MFGLLFKLRLEFKGHRHLVCVYSGSSARSRNPGIQCAGSSACGTIYSAKNPEFSEVIPHDSCNSTRTQPEFSYINKIPPLI